MIKYKIQTVQTDLIFLIIKKNLELFEAFIEKRPLVDQIKNNLIATDQ